MDQSTQSVVSAYPKSVISGFPLSVHQAIFDPGRSCALRVRNLLKETLMGKDDEIVAGHLGVWRKVANVRRDPRVVLSMETGGHAPNGLAEYLVVHGRARITEGGAPELLQRLAHVYLGPDVTFPPMDNPPPGYITRITPEKIGGVGPWRT